MGHHADESYQQPLASSIRSGRVRRRRLVARSVAILGVLGLIGALALNLPRWLNGPFSATGSMATAHSGGTATLLADGRVLVTGGRDEDGQMASAEVYDPATGSFAPAGSMIKSRDSQTATLLRDGDVLIAGGEDTNGNALNTAELYNPVTGSFTPTGPLGEARTSQTATLLDGGDVLIAGGEDTNGKALATAELYEPVRGTFAPTGSMEGDCSEGVATGLNDGRVLLVGCGTMNAASTEAEIYSPTTGRFSLTGPMMVPRDAPAVSLLADGRVLVTGGYQGAAGGSMGEGPVDSAEIFDPKSGTFAATGAMTEPRAGHSATLLRNGQVLVAGGWTAELYDPTSGTFHAILGGFDPFQQTPFSGENYPIGPLGLFRVPLTMSRTEHRAVLLRSGSVLLIGGYSPDGPHDSTELFNA